MKSFKFLANQLGKRCGFLTCKGVAKLPAYSFEKGNQGLWVTCGRIHKAVK